MNGQDPGGFEQKAVQQLLELAIIVGPVIGYIDQVGIS